MSHLRDLPKVYNWLGVEGCLEAEVAGQHQNLQAKFLSEKDHGVQQIGTYIFHQDRALTAPPVSMPNSRDEATGIYVQ